LAGAAPGQTGQVTLTLRLAWHSLADALGRVQHQLDEQPARQGRMAAGANAEVLGQVYDGSVLQQWRRLMRRRSLLINQGGNIDSEHGRSPCAAALARS
jgi:hypothetical protein